MAQCEVAVHSCQNRCDTCQNRCDTCNSQCQICGAGEIKVSQDETSKCPECGTKNVGCTSCGNDVVKVPVKIGNNVEMIDRTIAPLIKRLNSTTLGVCTLGSHEYNGTDKEKCRFYFDYRKYDKLAYIVHYVYFSISPSDSTKTPARFVYDTLCEYEIMDLRPILFGTNCMVIYAHMNRSDIENSVNPGIVSFLLSEERNTSWLHRINI